MPCIFCSANFLNLLHPNLRASAKPRLIKNQGFLTAIEDRSPQGSSRGAHCVFDSNKLCGLTVEHKIQNASVTKIHNYRIETVFMKIKGGR